MITHSLFSSGKKHTLLIQVEFRIKGDYITQKVTQNKKRGIIMKAIT